MRKRTYALVLLLIVALSLFGAGSKEDTKKTADVKTLRIFQFKTEIADELSELAKVYNREHPSVRVVIESSDSSTYDTLLRTKFVGGEAPDIFNNEGYEKRILWQEYLEDLSDQPWVKDMAGITLDGISDEQNRIYGLPLYLEGYGFVYNKRLFEKANITKLPTTLQEFDELCYALEAAGIPALNVPLGSWYNMGVFGVNVAVAHQPDVDAFIEGLNEGTENFVDNAIFHQWCDLLDIMLKHAYTDPLLCDFSAQLSEFGTEQVAMTLANNGAWPSFVAMTPDIDAGMMIVPINNDPVFNDYLYVGPSTYWVVNKNSPVKEEAKEFLTWLVTSEIGKKYVTSEFLFVSGLTSIEATEEDVGPLGFAVSNAVVENKALGWNWPKYPAGMTQEFGTLIQKYAAKEVDRTGMLVGFMDVWNSLIQKK